MSMPIESGRESEGEAGDEEPSVPVEVLEAIDNMADGNTASKDEIEDALKF